MRISLFSVAVAVDVVVAVVFAVAVVVAVAVAVGVGVAAGAVVAVAVVVAVVVFMIYDIGGVAYRWSASGLREAISASQQTQTSFADRIGVSRQSVSYWCGGIMVPRETMLPRISKALGVHSSLILRKVEQ